MSGLLERADHLACAVRDRDAAEITAVLSPLTEADLRALAGLLAEHYPVPPRCQNPRCGVIRKRRSSGEGIEGACGYCRACFDRWHRAGRPAEVPAPMHPAGRAAFANAERSRDREARMEEFASYRRQGCTTEMAARYVGVSADTGYRYAAELKRRQREEVIAA